MFARLAMVGAKHFARWASLLLMWLGVPLAWAQTVAMPSACTSPTVQVKVVVYPASVSHLTHSMALTIHSEKQKGRQHKGKTIGLYRSEQRVEVNSSYFIRDDAAWVCISGLDIVYRIEHQIDVGRDIPEGSCLFRETVNHERQHEQIHVTQAQAASVAIRRELGKGPLLFRGPRAKEDAQVWVKKAMTYAENMYSSYVLPAQARLDTEDEYLRIARLCR